MRLIPAPATAIPPSNKTQSTVSCAPALGRRLADRLAAPHGRRRASSGPRPRHSPPHSRSPTRHYTPPANNNRTEERRMACHQQPAPPPSDTSKMSRSISIGQEPVLADHAPPPPAAGSPYSHCPVREGSAPHCGTEYHWFLQRRLAA
jgi:hypothetical protein